MSWYTIIDALGTLILAIATVIALFIPSIRKKLYAPRFDIESSLNQKSEEILLKITNNGKSTAHDCKVAIEIYNDNDNDNDNDKCIINSFLGWDIKDYNRMIVREGGGDFKTMHIKLLPIIYDGITIYQNEYQFVKLFFKNTKNFAIYSFPYNNYSVNEPLIIQDSKEESELQFNKFYTIKITIFTEERTQKLKSLSFKIEDEGKTLYYGENKDNMNSMKIIDN